jgi:hypothetical protein
VQGQSAAKWRFVRFASWECWDKTVTSCLILVSRNSREVGRATAKHVRKRRLEGKKRIQPEGHINGD